MNTTAQKINEKIHDANVVKFDGVCVDLFFRRLATNGKLKKRDGE